MTLTDARLLTLGSDLQRLRGELADFRNTLRTCLIGLKTPVVDERGVARMTSALHPKVAALRPRLESISAQIPELSRQTHGGGSTSTFGRLGHIRGLLPIVESELKQCKDELDRAHSEVMAILQSPTRAPTLPSGDLSDLLEIAIDLLAKALQRSRS